MSLSSRPIRFLLVAVLLGYLAFIAGEYRAGYVAAARGDRPRFTDYSSLYGASMQLQAEPAELLFQPRRSHAWQLEAARRQYGESLSLGQARAVGYSPWMYPPSFMLFALPLALFPYLPSLAIWLSLTALPYLAAMRHVLGAGGGLAALAVPPAFFNLAFGQTGFLTAGFIGLGMANLPRRPLLAGALIGLASVKPHLGILLPVALACGAHWRAVAGAVASTLGLAALSALVFGWSAWQGFFGAMTSNIAGFGVGVYDWKSMTSVLGGAVLLGLPLSAAWWIQAVVGGLAAMLVGAVWWRGRTLPTTFGLQAAIVCLATPLAVPLAYHYDLVIVAPAVAWLWADLNAHGGTRTERWLLGLPLLALLFVYLAASRLGLPIAPPCIAILLGVALARFRQAGRRSAVPRDGR